MNYSNKAIVGLAILMAAYATHSRYAFIGYHAWKIVALLIGAHR